MKIIESFTDLEKANTYVAAINADYQSQATKLTDANAKIAALNTSLKELQDNLATSTSQVTAFATQLETAKTESAAALAEALEEISALGQKLALQENHGDKGLVISIGKKSYSLVGDSFVYGGGTKTAKELSQDQVQLKKMLEKQSGSLVEII